MSISVNKDSMEHIMRTGTGVFPSCFFDITAERAITAAFITDTRQSSKNPCLAYSEAENPVVIIPEKASR